jgi:ankyrin repeat protein
MSDNLVQAVEKGDVERCRALIEQGADVNLRTPLGTPVHRAAVGGRREILELLIEASSDLDQGNSLATPLGAAIGAGHQDIAVRLLEAGADPQRVPEFGGELPIFEAVKQNALNVVQALLNKGAAVDPVSREVSIGDPLAALGGMENFADLFKGLEVPDMGGPGESLKRVTPLHLAAVLGYAEIVRCLLEGGADPSRRDGEGRTVFELANGEASAMLLSCGASSPTATAEELLLLAAESGEESEVENQITNGADLETRDERSKYLESTPLMLAARRGHLGVARLLIEAGAAIDASEKEQKIPGMLVSEMSELEVLQMGYTLHRTSLMWALCNGHAEVALFLLKWGATYDWKDNLGLTPLHLAARTGLTDMVEALVKRGVKPDLLGRSKITPLMLACQEGQLDVVDWLVDQKQKLDRKDAQGDTAMIYACRGGHTQVVSRLLRAGCKADLMSRDGTAPLEALIGARREVPVSEASAMGEAQIFNERGHFTLAPFPEEQLLPVVQELLDSGADPNSNKGFATPLGEAARNEHLEIMGCLIQAGGDPDRGSRGGDSALDTAELFGKKKALEFLKSHSKGGSKRKTSRQRVKEPDRWGPDVVAPDFSSKMREPNFVSALERLEAICKSKATVQDNYVSVHLKTSEREDFSLLQLQREYLKKGVYLVNLSSQGTLIALPTTRWQDALAVVQTNGTNYGIGPGYVVEWMEALMREQPFELTTVAHDILAGEFLTEIEEPQALAHRMYEFCPDIVDQGTGSVEELADTLRENRTFFFWWD